ncbi:YidH family protein [Rhodococcus wratislaviensis]|uniref:YidH family protein n=1 Tax=Rhodococcus wratislaviensis TaxID=44752 RepID=UPI003516DB18
MNAAADTETEPDYRFTLANERTFLAWIRTALALLAGGVAVSQFYVPHGGSAFHDALGGVCILLAALVAAGALMRWRSVQSAMRRAVPLPASRLAPAVVAGVCLAAVLGVVWAAT